MKIREDLTVIMVAPKCPGTEVREEYKRGFGVPTLIAVHEDNDPRGEGLAIAKAYAAGTGGHKAGVLMSSFIAEVKSDLMGEQTILCGMLQTGSLLCYDKMIEVVTKAENYLSDQVEVTLEESKTDAIEPMEIAKIRQGVSKIWGKPRDLVIAHVGRGLFYRLLFLLYFRIFWLNDSERVQLVNSYFCSFIS